MLLLQQAQIVDDNSIHVEREIKNDSLWAQ